ncbi:MAG: ankyrin repeat domain-containing protein [Desulfobacteraceae bacterium]|jgi:ankyrin repeat protein
MKNEIKRQRSGKIAQRISLFCIAVNLPLIAFIMFGPKEGMEELAIIVPWLLTVAVNIILIIPALAFALSSRRHLANIWIYAYFTLFFGFHIILIIHESHLAERLHQQFIKITNPDRAEFHKLLSELRYIPDDDKASRVKELILKDVDVNSVFPGDKYTPLHKAAYNGDPVIIKLMLDKGALVDAPPDVSITPLGRAIQKNNTEAAQLLLGKGADPNRGVSGYTYIVKAVQKHNYDIVEALLKAGAADPNLRIYGPEKPLIIAAMNGDKDILKLLLENGADPEYKMSASGTALAIAVTKGYPECVRVLLNAGVKLSGNGPRGRGILSLAATCGNPEIVSLIQKAAQSVVVLNDYEEPSFCNRYRDLRKALEENRFDDFKKMIQIGILPDSTSDHGHTLLQLFCMNSLSRVIRMDVLPVVQFLIENGADMNRRLGDGTTPLMLTVRYRQTDLLKLLIQKGADINAVNNSGHNALYYARTGKQKTIEEILTASGAKYEE